jgi:hypothetical protein
MTTIPFSGSVNRDNYGRAVRLAIGPGRRSKIVTVVFVSLLFAASVVGPLAAGASVRPWLPFWGLVLIVGLVYFFLPRLGVKRAIETNKLLQEPIEGAAEEDAIRMTTPSSSITLRWDSFHRMKASADMVLLYQASNLFNMFPREFFGPEEDWQTFRSWALAKAPKPARKSRPIWTFLLWMVLFFLIILVYNFWSE